jgi:hypothetical protein
MLYRTLACALLVLLFATVVRSEPITDGPYVWRDGAQLEVTWICADQTITRQQPSDQSIEPACGAVPTLTLESAPRTAADSLPSVERWAAISDIHGQTDRFLQLLRAQRILGASGDWAWGAGVLIITGDVLDRGPTQIEALWAIYRMAQQASAAGGRVELLLGNHEAMVMAGDLRYLHPRYLRVAKQLGRRYDQLFAADTELGAWLRRRAVVLKLGDTLFLHGGLHPRFADAEFDLATINAQFRAGLGVTREAIHADPAAHWLFGSDGPVWYRGYFEAEMATLAQVDALLAAAQVRRIVVGHTTVETIRVLYEGRVIGIDSGLKYGDQGELLIHEDGTLWRGLVDGQRAPLPASLR